MSETREWWLSAVFDHDADAFKWIVGKPFENNNISLPEDIRVVEISALVKAREEIERQRLSMTTGDRNWCGLNETIKSIESKLAKAKEALDEIARGNYTGASFIARAAIQEIWPTGHGEGDGRKTKA